MKIDINKLPLKEEDVKLTNNIIYEFTEDIEENDFLIFEAISKEQKEKGQREMWKLTHHVINKLEEYFNKRWQNPINLKYKKEEKIRLNEFKEYFNKYESSEETIKFYKEKIGVNPKFPINSVNKEDTISPAGVEPYTLQTTFNRGFNVKNIAEPNRYLNGFDFTKKQAKENENIIWKFIIMHEQGHLFDYLKQVIITGSIEPVGTAMFQFDQKEKVNNSETNANAYAIDNMYRKDRREFLKNSKFEKTDKLEKLKDAYKKGLDDKSKTLDKTLKSIEKEKYFNY